MTAGNEECHKILRIHVVDTHCVIQLGHGLIYKQDTQMVILMC